MLEFVSHPGFVGIVGLAVIGTVWKFGAWYGAVNSDRESFKDFTKEIRNELKAIHTEIKRIFEKMPSSTVETKSPVTLTELGETVSKSVNAPQWAAEQASTLLRDAFGKAEFEVFDLCVEHVDRKFRTNPDFRRLVRAAAYDQGTSEIDVLKVYHVVLRDEVLKQLGTAS